MNGNEGFELIKNDAIGESLMPQIPREFLVTPASPEFRNLPSSFRSHFFVPLDEAFSAASAILRVITANNFLGPRSRVLPAGVRPDARVADGRGINPNSTRVASFTPPPPAGSPKSTEYNPISRGFAESLNIK